MKHRMKIAVVTEICNAHSGIRVPVELAKRFAQNHEVIFFAYDLNTDLETKNDLEKNQVKVSLLKTSPIPLLGKYLGALKLPLILKKGNFDIVSLHAALPLLLGSSLSGVPVVKNYYGVQKDAYLERYSPNQKPPFWAQLINHLLNLAILTKEMLYFKLPNKTLAISQYTAKEAKKLFGQKISYFYLGADSEALVKTDKPTQKDNSVKILSVSRFTPYKGFHLLIKVFNKLNKKFPQTKLILAGSAPKKNYLNYLKKIKNKNVKILINVSDKKLARLYQESDFYVTCDRYLFFGLPPVEAAHFGKPSLALNFCAAPEIIKHGQTGYVAENLATFTRYIEKLTQDKNLRKHLGQRAKKRAEEIFLWDKIAPQHEALFKTILEKEKPKKNLPFFSLLLVGFILRLVFLKEKPIWFDEVFSFAIARQNLSRLVTATLADNNPPFYYFFLHFWLKFNQSEFFLRLPSMVFGLVSIFLIYLVAQKLFAKKVAFISSLILALSPLHVYFSAEARMYSLWTMLTLAGFYFFLKILSRPQKTDYLLFNILFLISLYTQYFTIFFLLSLDFFLILKRKKFKKQFINLLLGQIVIALLFLPWAFYFLVNPHPQPWETSPLIGIPATFLSFVLGGVGAVTLKTFFAPPVPLLIRAVFIFVSVLFGLLFLLGSKNKEKNEEKTLLLLLVFLPILVTALIALFYPIYSPRPFLVFSPYFYILTAKGIESLDKKRRFWTKILMLTLLLFTLFVQNFYPPFKPQTLKEAVVFIKKSSPRPPPIVHTDILTFYPFTYYFPEPASQFLVFPSGLAKKTTDIIGGSPVSLSVVTAKNEPFFSVHFTWDGKTWQFKENQLKLKKNYQYEQVVTINDLEIFYYQPLSTYPTPSTSSTPPSTPPFP